MGLDYMTQCKAFYNMKRSKCWQLQHLWSDIFPVKVSCSLLEPSWSWMPLNIQRHTFLDFSRSCRLLMALGEKTCFPVTTQFISRPTVCHSLKRWSLLSAIFSNTTGRQTTYPSTHTHRPSLPPSKHQLARYNLQRSQCQQTQWHTPIALMLRRLKQEEWQNLRPVWAFQKIPTQTARTCHERKKGKINETLKVQTPMVEISL